MELLYLDNFESIDVGAGYVPNSTMSEGQFRFVAGAWAHYNSPMASASSGLRNVAGSISAKTFAGSLSNSATTRTYYIEVGDYSNVQTAGKLVFGFAYSTPLSEAQTFAYLVGSSGTYPISINTSRSISFSGSSGVATSVIPNSYFYIELVIDLDEGTFEVYVEDTLLFSGTNAFSDLYQVIQLHMGGVDPRNRYWDNIYILGETTGNIIDRFGPITVARVPLLASKVSNWAPNTGTNLANVNKTDLSTDTWNRSPLAAFSPDRFSIDPSSLPGDKDIVGLAVQGFAKKADTLLRDFRLLISGSGGADKVSKSAPVSNLDFYGTIQLGIGEFPGGGALTKTNLADIEVGYECGD